MGDQHHTPVILSAARNTGTHVEEGGRVTERVRTGAEHWYPLRGGWGSHGAGQDRCRTLVPT